MFTSSDCILRESLHLRPQINDKIIWLHTSGHTSWIIAEHLTKGGSTHRLEQKLIIFVSFFWRLNPWDIIIWVILLGIIFRNYCCWPLGSYTSWILLVWLLFTFIVFSDIYNLIASTFVTSPTWANWSRFLSLK